MKVIFITCDGTAEQTIDISPDSKLSENREEVQMLLGLPANQPHNLILERTGRKLKDSLTFEAAGIQDDDKLIVTSSDEPEINPSKEFTSTLANPSTEKKLINHLASTSKPISKLSNSDNRLIALIIGGSIGILLILSIVINSLNKNPKQPQQSSQTSSTLSEDTLETNATVAGELGTKKNIRSGPGTDYRIVNEIPSGNKIIVLSDL